MDFENSFKKDGFLTILDPRRSIKKHKRSLSIRAELTEGNSDSSLNTSFSKTKTKYKHNNDDGSELSDNYKNRKRRHRSTEDYDPSCGTENTIDSVTLCSDVNFGSSTTPRKKKKKRNKSYETPEESVCANESYEQYQNVADGIEKKKKKRKRNKSCETTEESVCANESYEQHKNIADVIEKNKKKKKKRRNHEVIDAIETGNDEQQLFISPVIDRNSNEGMNFDDVGDYVIATNKKKKKKKRRNLEEMDTTETGNDEQQPFISPVRDRNSNVGMNFDDAGDYAIEKNKKKKKRRNQEEIEASDTLNEEQQLFISPVIDRNNVGMDFDDATEYVIEKNKKRKKKQRNHAEIDASDTLNDDLQQQSFCLRMSSMSSDDQTDATERKKKKNKERNYEKVETTETKDYETDKKKKSRTRKAAEPRNDEYDESIVKTEKVDSREELNETETRNSDDDSVYPPKRQESIRGLKELRTKVQHRVARTPLTDSDNSCTNSNNNNEINVKCEQTENELNEWISQDLFSQSPVVEQHSIVDSSESITNDHVESTAEDSMDGDQPMEDNMDDDQLMENNTDDDQPTEDNMGDDQPTEYKSFDNLDIILDGIPLLHNRTLARPSPEDLRRYEAKGIYVKQGMWSLEEKLKLKSNWKKLHETYPGYNMRELLFQKKHLDTKRRVLQFLGQGLNSRTLRAIYDKTRDCFLKTVEGKFSMEEKEKLNELILENGEKWAVLAKSLNRSACSVHDLIRKTKTRKTLKLGHWTDDENDKLETAVERFVGADNFKADNKNVYIGIQWAKIAHCVGTRNDTQCRQQWLNHGYKILLSEDEIAQIKEWNAENSLKLIECIKEQKVEDIGRIDWFKLAQRFRPMNMYVLRMKFIKLKYLIVDYKKKRLKDILRELTHVFR